MDLYSFLARSLELLSLIEQVEQRQTAIATGITAIEAFPAGDVQRDLILARLREAHRRADADLASALDLLQDF
jgi:hypothetical protein